MARDKSKINLPYIYRDRFDLGNIPGKVLADVGRAVISGTSVNDIVKEVQREVNKEFGIKEGDYTHMGWLDMRVEEICKKGRL